MTVHITGAVSANSSLNITAGGTSTYLAANPPTWTCERCGALQFTGLHVCPKSAAFFVAHGNVTGR